MRRVGLLALPFILACAHEGRDPGPACQDPVLVETRPAGFERLRLGLAGAPVRLLVHGDATAGDRARSVERLSEALRDCREAWLALQGSVSPRLTVEVLLGRLTGQAA